MNFTLPLRRLTGIRITVHCNVIDMQPSFDLLVAGEINPDLIVTGDVIPAFGQAEKLVDSAKLTIGSSSAIFMPVIVFPLA